MQDLRRKDLGAWRVPAPQQIAAPISSTAAGTPLILSKVSKSFRRRDGTLVEAVADVDLQMYDGEILVLLGPSGCGKTTLLRSIAGLETPDGGEVFFDGNCLYSASSRINVPAEARQIGMMFQSYALWPHMTVYKNVAYPLESQRLPRAEIADRVTRTLALVNIAELRDQYPGQLSGGQQQRVALARAIVGNRRLVLFDEPLSNVDARVRSQLRFELVAMQRRIGFSAVYVTHDQEEALGLADRVAVLKDGHIAQLDTPEAVYHRPVSRYVANFVGTANELLGMVVNVSGHRLTVETVHGPITVEQPDSNFRAGENVAILGRPEAFYIDEKEPSLANRWLARHESSLFVGSRTEHSVRSGDSRFAVWRQDAKKFASQSDVWISVDPTDLSVVAE